MRATRTFGGAMVLLALAAAAGAARAQPASERCARLNRAQIAALFDRWNASLQTGDPDAVVRNYVPDAVLLPTLSDQARTSPAAIRAYFVDFLKKHPSGVIDTRIVKIGCNMAYDVGTYTFTVDGDQPGSRVKVPARYTFIYENRGRDWQIVHQHSSPMPQPP